MLKGALPLYKTGWFYLLLCFWLVSLWSVSAGYFSDVNQSNLVWLVKQNSASSTIDNSAVLSSATQPSLTIFIASIGLFFVGIYLIWRLRAERLSKQGLMMFGYIIVLFVMQYSLAIYQHLFVIIPMALFVVLSWPFIIAFHHEESIFISLQQENEQLLFERIQEYALANQVDKLANPLAKLAAHQSIQEEIYQLALQAEKSKYSDVAHCLYNWNEQSGLIHQASHEKIIEHKKALLHAKTAKQISEREQRVVIEAANTKQASLVKQASLEDDDGQSDIAQNYTAPKRTESNQHQINWQKTLNEAETSHELDNSFDLVDSVEKNQGDILQDSDHYNNEAESDLAATLVINQSNNAFEQDELEATLVLSSQDDLAQTQAKLSVTQAFKPQSFGRYQVEGLLGKGAMGIVYRGVDPKINRHVAIKSLQLSDSVDQEEVSQAKQRFFREAETAGGLSHANIVTIYDVGDEGSLGYIAMDLLTGAPLSHFIHVDKLLPTPLIYQLMIQITDALEYAHRQSVVHRDIKPGNIIYDDDLQKATVTDFGIAYVTDNSRTSTGVIMGSPYYMSPEQITGGSVDGRSDIFSLGATFYQLLSGQLPFEGDSVVSVAYQISNAKQIKVTEHKANLPPSAARITNKALQKDATKRYQSMQEFKQALINALKRDFKQAPII
ncbi:serine/threonine protein kinase [Litorilituus lipolyticus]|uniref:non-specific serine/threonine protein kinase n=1 Tax=Litorilituus lipolyticus TaxID=2491017 RepID=A0A502KXT4_9GAMM|nr:serine/threonine-protein kinase [Litorilituus lipolyticus]TPH16458.1 serine/threonine protein kinase [Litorilituus lipolyticus]